MRALGPILALGLIACGEATPVTLPQGQWSGPSANLFVTPTATTLELICRQADLPEPLALSSRGAFRVDTTMASYGITVTYSPVSIAGKLDEEVLHLTVATPGVTAERFVLVRQTAPHLPRCG